MINIAIAGIGGVGGYIGGMLARHYAASNEVNLHFICRGESEKRIREKGLKLDIKEGVFVVKPHSIDSDASTAGPMDFLLLCTKSYDLKNLVNQLTPFIQPNTIILPLYNGVDSYEKIKDYFPANEVWNGCVYMVARRVEPGYVKESGHNARLLFGLKNGNRQKLELFETLTRNAGIHSTLSENIEKTVWEKFIFISVMATLTSYYNQNFGDLLANEKTSKHIDLLLNEILQLAAARHIPLDADIKEQTLDKIRALTTAATSSMHADFMAGKPTELHSLTGYVVQQGRLYNLEMPEYRQLYENLKFSFGNYKLQLLKTEDALPFYQLIQKNHDRLFAFFPLTAKNGQSLDSTRAMVKERIALAEKKAFISFMIFKRDDNTLLGCIFMKDIDWHIPKAEIGYFIDRDFESNGIVGGALRTIVHYCFNELKLEKVFVRVSPENIGSRKVAEKNGFELEGILRKDFKSGEGTLYDVIYYGLLNEH